MIREKKEDLSVFYYFTDLFAGTTINIVDAFPEELLVIPTVSIETYNIVPVRFELGNKVRNKIRSWTIDVFAQNKSQRDDITYTILNALEECIPVYDYDLGFPPTVVPQLGCLDIDRIRADWVRVLPQLTSKMYYRTSIVFTANYTNI